MNILVKDRGLGKTTELIKLAIEQSTGYLQPIIVCYDTSQVDNVNYILESCDVPCSIKVITYLGLYSLRGRKNIVLLIDNIDMWYEGIYNRALYEFNILLVTASPNENHSF